jgi:hypothetical protein
MTDNTPITFSHRDVAEALVKKQGLHDGIWGIYVEFGVQGANIGTDPKKKDLVPAAIVPILRLGIQRFPEENQLTVDAAKVNPIGSKPTAKGTGRQRKQGP